MKKQLNTWTLSGLMIGPILGSGIIFLPALAFKALGQFAIWSWVIMMLLGGLFAYVFAKMSILATGNNGMSEIIGQVLGERFSQLASNYLTIAVCFGPVAVILTASGFIHDFLPYPISTIIISYILLLLCMLIISLGITAVGRLLLVVSTLTAILLVSSSIGVIISVDQLQLPKGLPPIKDFGSTLLLIFWSIIGWEIIGNYIEDVKNPDKTIMRAMKVSLIAIVIIYLVTTFALQNYYIEPSEVVQLQVLLIPLFGTRAPVIFSLLATCLCICTILMFVGAVSRQMISRAKEGQLPAFFSRNFSSLIALTLVHTLVLAGVAMHIINLEWIVGIANTFFICNALLGLLTSWIYMQGFWIRCAIAILIIILILLLFFSSTVALGLLVAVTLLSSLVFHLNRVKQPT